MATTSTSAGQGPGAKPARRVKLTPPLYKAVFEEKVREESSADRAAIQRIQNILDRANAERSSEAEAKASLLLAEREMTKHNITHADLLANASPEEQAKYGGMQTVSLVRCDGDLTKRVLHSNYLDSLCVAIRLFFNVKSYSTISASALKVTFYGIATNTVVAANAFVKVYNLIVGWARPHKGTSGKNSYCFGICDGLQRIAEREQDFLMEQAQLAEAAKTREKGEQRVLGRQQPESTLGASSSSGVVSGDLEQSNKPQAGNPGEMSDSTSVAPEIAPEDSDWEGFEDDMVVDSEPVRVGDGTVHIKSQPRVASVSEHVDVDDQTSSFAHGGAVPGGDHSGNGWAVEDTLMTDALESNVASDTGSALEDWIASPIKYEDSGYSDVDITSDEVSVIDDDSMSLGDENDYGCRYKSDVSTADLDCIDLTDDMDEAISKLTELISKEEQKHEQVETGCALYYSSVQQLEIFRQNASDIADEWLKTSGPKLYKGRKRGRGQLDYTVYSKGKKDAKKIDVRGNSLE